MWANGPILSTLSFQKVKFQVIYSPSKAEGAQNRAANLKNQKYNSNFLKSLFLGTWKFDTFECNVSLNIIAMR